MGTAQGLLVRAVALGALAFSVLWPRSALADAAREAAADHFDRGLAYVDQREFSLAVQEFERAYELGRHFGVLYNLGLAYAAVGRYEEAAQSLNDYLRQGDEELTEERRASLAVLIEQYQKKLGKLVVATVPAGADVSIGGERQQDASAISLDPGRHVITARAEGYLASTAVVELAAGEQKALVLTLRPVKSGSESNPALERPVAPTPPMPPQLEMAEKDRTLVYVLGGTAVALGGAALGIFLHDNARHDEWKRTEEELPPPGSPLTNDQRRLRADQDETRRSIETWDKVALGMGIAAGATLGAATVLWFAAPDESAARVSPVVGLGMAGVRGAF